jgi:ADP-heptose:LPS heptosyltransferase
MRRLLIRPGAIGDFIVSLPAMEALRGDYTEVWCAQQNVPLARFANASRSIIAAGLDRLGLLPADEVIERLRSFDAILSWYGTQRDDFRKMVRSLDLPFEFLPALPDGGLHAVDYYRGQVNDRPVGRFPRIECPDATREFAVIHPFASSVAKRAPMEWFESAARVLGESMPVHWLCGPEEQLTGAVRIDDLYELACWLRRARIFVGNDSGISHLAAAVGTPVYACFRTTDPKIWAPRGLAVACLLQTDSRGSNSPASRDGS